MIRFVLGFVLMAGLASLVTPAVAGDADDKFALTIAATKGETQLDLTAIKGMGSETIKTSTDWDWHEGPQEFSGVPAMALLEKAGITAGKIKVIAADEYAVSMDVADLARHGAIIATSLNGAALTDESFGPLWLIFPYDKMGSKEERDAYTARSVWSIVKITAE